MQRKTESIEQSYNVYDYAKTNVSTFNSKGKVFKMFLNDNKKQYAFMSINKISSKVE